MGKKFFFKKLKKFLKEKNRKIPEYMIYVYSSEKANGENFQLSYNRDFDSWVIGSKNFTLVLKDISDLEFYKTNDFYLHLKKKKYSFCLNFAYFWFEILQLKFSDGDLLEEFKKDLSGRTLISEHVGDEFNQHIKYYKEKDFFFRLWLKNNSDFAKICENFLRRFNLKMVNYSKSHLLKTEEELEDYLKKLNKRTLLENEGKVLYFSQSENDEEEIVQLAKLKTFEYRFLRKLRKKGIFFE